MKVYQYYVHPKMTSYSGKRRSKERKIWNQFAFSDDAILYTHTTVPISTRNDEEIADNHLVDTVYSSKQKLLLQIRDSTKITTTTEKSTSKRASSYFRKRALDYCLYTLKKIMFYHHRSFFFFAPSMKKTIPPPTLLSSKNATYNPMMTTARYMTCVCTTTTTLLLLPRFCEH